MIPESGLILIDKPKGPTSQRVSLWVKEILGRKVCHVGTLDPFATGILPILFGKGIKIQEYMQIHRKEYHCLLEFEKKIDKKELEKMLEEFKGKIFQKPPEISAVAKRTRVRKIYYIEILEIQNNHVILKIGCQHGTYIRKLVDDLSILTGEKIKLLELRRTKVEHFKEEQAINLTKLRDYIELKKIDEICLPLLEGVKHYPRIEIRDNAVESILNGAPLAAPGLKSWAGDIKEGKEVAIINNGELIAMGIASKNHEKLEDTKKGIITKIDKVIKKKAL